MSRRPCTAARLLATLCLATPLLAGCGASAPTAPVPSTGPGAGGPATTTAAKGLSVVATFYPLSFAAEQIGGPQVSVTNLTKPGVEPHDVELTPADVATLEQAALVVYLKGFQPAVDAAVTRRPATALDVSGSARLTALAPAGNEEPADEHGHAEATDPHFWLDPTRYRDVAAAMAQRFAALDPTHAAQYQARATAFQAKLTALDTEFRQGLKSCASTNLVTSHSAFGYLASAYGLTQRGITGLSPEAEPNPQTMAAVTTFIKANKVSTVYSETLVNPALAEAVARESGASLKVLDPIEGLTNSSPGRDYFEVMRANLTTLKAGQQCR